MNKDMREATVVHPVLTGEATYYSPNSSLQDLPYQVMSEARVHLTYPEGREREALAALRKAAQVIEERMGPQWNQPESIGAEWSVGATRRT